MKFKVVIMVLLCLLLSVTAFAADADGDGMDDAWEKTHRLNPENPMDADLDLDGDKISNLDEFKIGTNPRNGKDRNGNGIPDDWEKYYFKKTGIDAKGDPDKDGFSNLDEFNNGTNPFKAEKKKKETREAFKRPKRNNSNIYANVLKGKNVKGKNKIVFHDPIGDDKGPGYYSYPTNPVYVPGGFDLTKVEIDGDDDKYIMFKIHINANFKQDWGMAADFDVQFIQIYIDTDNEPGSGQVATLPGLNLYIAPATAWDRCILISPQPESRVLIEIEAKAPKDMQNLILVPKRTSASGKTLSFRIKKSALGIDKDKDITKFGWQFFMQSNEGFPDKLDLLTRDVNEYNGLHRFGGGNDYWGDPEIMDMLAWPGKGTLAEAKRQFDILDVWESYPDPTTDVRAVVPLLVADSAKAVDVTGLAKFVSEKMRPKKEKDRYVSDNFTFAGSANVQWLYNKDASPIYQAVNERYTDTGEPAKYDNTINSRFTLEFYGKVFTDKVNFYARLETWWDRSSEWDSWGQSWDTITEAGNGQNKGPGYTPMEFQSFRFQFVKPLPTVDFVSVGNYEMHHNAWTVGKMSYPDRDKFKGVFVDGSATFLNLKYNVAYFMPAPWVGLSWQLGEYTKKDTVLAASVKTIPINGLKLNASGYYYSDVEVDTADTSAPIGTVNRLQNTVIEVDFEYDLPLLKGMNFSGLIAISDLTKGEGIITGGPVLEGNQVSGQAMIGTFKWNNILSSPFQGLVQGFYIKDFSSVMAARGNYISPGSVDVLAMYGNQSAHNAPQNAAGFMKWGNPMWETVSSSGWQGLTALGKYISDNITIHGEFSTWTFTDEDYNKKNEPSAQRIYAKVKYTLDIFKGIDIEGSFLMNMTKNWWPMTPYWNQRNALGYAKFPHGFELTSMIPTISVSYPWTKSFRSTIGYEYRRDHIKDLWTGDWSFTGPTPDFYVASHSLFVDLQWNTPLGTLRSYVIVYSAQNDRRLDYGQFTYADDWRKPYAYHTATHGFVAHTELDIHF